MLSKKYRPLHKRLFSFVLAFVMLLACFLPVAPMVFAEAGYDRTADPSTINDWTDYFGENVVNTVNVGRIWTDKSVFDASSVTLDERNVTVPRADSDNFLVGLSALSSFKNIMGQTNVPIDVVMILDISSSMRTPTDNGAITSMVAATNNSIDTLQGLNDENRVGVVLFDNDAFLALGIDRYDGTGTGGTYLSVVPGTHEKDIEVHANYENTPNPAATNGTIQASSGTFTQAGFSQALQQFLAATPTDSSGNARMPIIVFMSDGSPTVGTTDYTADLENGASMPMKNGKGTVGLTFVTQLTAAYTLAQMESHYNRTPLFYSLGFGLESLTGNTGVLARAVLDPSFSTQELDDYWNEFLALPPDGSQSMLVKNTSTQYSLTRVADDLNGYTDPSHAAIQYVNQYFAAEQADQLDAVFAEIVEEIELQSRYYPTQTGGNNVDMSGYLHFEDDIGEYMSVNNVTGLVYDTELFTGATFAEVLSAAYAIYTTGNGDTDDPSDGEGGTGTESPSGNPAYTNHVYEFIKSSASRLGITTGQALTLIENAFLDGQIYYNSSTDFGNYILWYGDDNDVYKGPASIGDTAADVPSGATKLNKSYVFFREEETVGMVGPDLMYVGVRVKTDLATNKQTVIFTVPASLVPVMEYDITLDNDNIEQATEAIVSRQTSYPICLFYEVGLRKEITAATVSAIVPNTYAYLNSGEYTFYTDAWSGTEDTTASFTPAQENEFYYYYKDTTVYQEVGPGTYVPLDTPPVLNQTYYYLTQEFTLGNGVTATPVNQVYTPIPGDVSSTASPPDLTHTAYYMAKGTPKLGNFSYTQLKSTNPTSTYNYARTLTPFDTGSAVNISVQLGNNGLLRLRALDPGNLQVSKTVGGSTGETDKDFDFTVTLNHKFINGVFGDVTFTNGVATFSLKHGESVLISGLPAGTTYTVTEASYNGDGYSTTFTGATGTIQSNVTLQARFHNTRGTVTPGPGGETGVPPFTGDTSNLTLWLILAIGSGLTLIVTGTFALLKKRHTRKKYVDVVKPT